MAEKNKRLRTYKGVCVYKSNHVYVATIDDKLAEQEDHGLIFRWFNNGWSHRALTFTVGSMCLVEKPKPLVMTMGIAGEINIFTNPGNVGAATEHVDTSPEGPSQLLPLKCIRSIGEHVYVVGMARHVYRRESDNNWIAIDKDIFTPREDRAEAKGLMSIDGFNEESIWAVGYKGEIWKYNGKNWTSEESPTKVVLTCLRCTNNNEVYAAGMAGTFLQNIQGKWTEIKHSATRKDFWGMTIFKDKIYLSNHEGLFVFENETLVPVDLGFPQQPTTAYLDSNDGVIWSVGEKDILVFDGKKWKRYIDPDNIA